MDITYDPAKDVTNQAKHGCSLSMAAQLNWSEMMVAVDDRIDYRELREVGFGFIGERLYVVVFTQRGDTMHVIGLRKANRREVKRYAEQI